MKDLQLKSDGKNCPSTLTSSNVIKAANSVNETTLLALSNYRRISSVCTDDLKPIKRCNGVPSSNTFDAASSLLLFLRN